jgi:hypothetical protein
MSTRGSVLGFLLSVVATSGCSLLFVDGPPPERARQQSIKCTDSNFWPVVDVLWAGFQVGRTAFAVSRDDSYYKDNPLSRESDIALGIAFLGLHTVSSVVGFRAVSQCNEALGDERARRGVYRGRPRVPVYGPSDGTGAPAAPPGVTGENPAGGPARPTPAGAVPGAVDDEDPDGPPPAPQPVPAPQRPSGPTWQAPGTPGRGGG